MSTKDQSKAPSTELNKEEFSETEMDSVPLTWRFRVQRSKNLQESFTHALRGLELAFAAERNLKIHLACAFVSVCLGVFLAFDAVSWTLLLLAVGLVIVSELMNTAVERVVDMVSGGQFHILAKEAKDIAAAGVVVASLAALAIGAVLFLPKLLFLITHHQ